MVSNFVPEIKHRHIVTEFKVELCNIHGRIYEHMFLKLNVRT